MTYVAQWPILDPDQRLSDLIPQAWPEAIRMMLRDGCRPTGNPDWSAEEYAGQIFLNMRVAVEPYEPDKEAA